MVRCDSCGDDLPEGARFCSSCGARMGGVGKEGFAVSSEDLVGRIKELLHKGDVTRVVVKDGEGRTRLGRGSRSNIGSLAGSFGCDSGFGNKMHCHRC